MREVLQIAESYGLSEITDEYDGLFDKYIDNAYYKYKVLAASK